MKQSALVVFVVILIMLVGCGENLDNGKNYEVAGIRTLTVRAHNKHAGVLQQAADAVNESWRVRGYEYTFNLEIEGHDWTLHTHEQEREAREARHSRLSIELMAGQGPDIFFFEEDLNLRGLARSGFLVDIYTLIDNCHYSNREDFFTNVLNAFEINDGLYMFPVSFGFYHIGINASLPYSDRFAQESTITLSQMMDIYLDISDNYFEFSHLVPGVAQCLSSFDNLAEAGIGGFVDFETRTANLVVPEFVSFLNLLQNFFDGNDHVQGSLWGINGMATDDFLRDISNEHFFEMHSMQLAPASAFLERSTPYFVNYRPLADDNGRLLINAHGDNVWAALSVTTVGDSALAWEFIRHLLNAYYEPVGAAMFSGIFSNLAPWAGMSFATPIKRSHFPGATLRTFESVFDIVDAGYHEVGLAHLECEYERNLQIENALRQIAELNDMPMVMLSPMIPTRVYAQGTNFENFAVGAITAEDLAQRIQNSISIWLIE